MVPGRKSGTKTTTPTLLKAGVALGARRSNSSLNRGVTKATLEASLFALFAQISK